MGSTGNGKLTDGLSAQLLAASSDKRFGSGAIRNVTVWEWVDVENAMKYLADAFVKRLVTLDVAQTADTSTPKQRMMVAVAVPCHATVSEGARRGMPTPNLDRWQNKA